jgi:integrase/recombinase XerC
MLLGFTNHLLASGRAPGTVAQRVMHIEHLARVHPDLATVTTADLETFLAARRTTHRAETRKTIRASFRVYFAWAHRVGLHPADPAQLLMPIRIPATVPRLAPDDAIQRALTGAPLRETGMILLGRLACLRLTELSTLQIRHRERDVLRILGKGEKQRLVYLNDALIPVLDELETEAAGSPWYFPGRFTGHIHPQAAHKIIQRRTGWNPHSLRHAGATAAYRATGDLRAVQEMLGHASMATTQRYLHLDETARRAVAAGTAFLHAA